MARPALVQVHAGLYTLSKGASCCILVQDNEAIIFDTGLGKDAGRYLKQACEQLAVTPLAIITSHAHADHYGGNAYLVNHYGMPVCAPAFEASIMREPRLEPLYLFSGATPHPALLSKWLLAPASPVDAYLSPGVLEISGFCLECIATPGHAHEHYALRYGDSLLVADALFGSTVLARYGIPYGQDITKQIASATMLADRTAKHIVMGHGDPSVDLAALVYANLAAFHRAADTVLVVVKDLQAASTETIMQQVCTRLAITIDDVARYYLHHSVVLAYLSYLQAQTQVRSEMQGNLLHWCA